MKSVLYSCYVEWKEEERRGTGRNYKPLLALRKESSREDSRDSPCNDNKVYHVAMHETLVVPVCAWQMVQKKSFMRENYREGRTNPAQDRAIEPRVIILNTHLCVSFS